MKTAKIVLFSFLGFVVLVIVFFYNFFINWVCLNQILSETFSPACRYRAVVFVRDCGATTSSSTQVSVMSADNSLHNSDNGNVFIEDLDHDYTLTLKVCTEWLGPNELLIYHDAKARVFMAEKQIDVPVLFFFHEKVTVKYKKLETNELKKLNVPSFDW